VKTLMHPKFTIGGTKLLKQLESKYFYNLFILPVRVSHTKYKRPAIAPPK
jgi:hypothetical protein